AICWSQILTFTCSPLRNRSPKVRTELRPNSGHVTFELTAFSLATSHQPWLFRPRETWRRGIGCMVLAICHAPTLPDLYWSPLIEGGIHPRQGSARYQQEVDLFVVIGIRACKHPSRLSPSV